MSDRPAGRTTAIVGEGRTITFTEARDPVANAKWWEEFGKKFSPAVGGDPVYDFGLIPQDYRPSTEARSSSPATSD